MTYPCTMFFKPDGRSELGNIANIYDEDVQWMTEHNAKLSMEELTTGQFACYLDVGLKDEDNEPLEAIEISFGRTCEETLKSLCEQAREMLGEK